MTILTMLALGAVVFVLLAGALSLLAERGYNFEMRKHPHRRSVGGRRASDHVLKAS